MEIGPGAWGMGHGALGNPARDIATGEWRLATGEEG